MGGLFIYFFFLIILLIALAKWNLSNLEKIKDLEKSNKELIEASHKIIKKNGK